MTEHRFAYPLVHPLRSPTPSCCFDSVPVEQQPEEAEEPEHLQHILLLLPQLQCGPASQQHQLPAATCRGERIASQGGAAAPLNACHLFVWDVVYDIIFFLFVLLPAPVLCMSVSLSCVVV